MCAPVAQGIERLPPEQKAAGSNPAGGTFAVFYVEFVRSPIVLVVCVAMPLTFGAAPAAAAGELMSGDYQVRVDGSGYGVWTFAPDCDVPADGCTARVEAHPKGWTAVATLSQGRWSLTRTSEKLFSCGDGSSSPGELRAAWNAGTLTGSLLLVPNGKRCGGSDAPLRGALKLVRA